MQVILEILPYHAKLPPETWRVCMCISRGLWVIYEGASKLLTYTEAVTMYGIKCSRSYLHEFRHGKWQYNTPCEGYYHLDQLVWERATVVYEPTITVNTPVGRIIVEYTDDDCNILKAIKIAKLDGKPRTLTLDEFVRFAPQLPRWIARPE